MVVIVANHEPVKFKNTLTRYKLGVQTRFELRHFRNTIYIPF